MIDSLLEQINNDRDSVEEFIVDNTLLKEGLYFVVDIDKPFTKKSFKNYLIVPKKIQSINDYKCSLGVDKKQELIRYITERDCRVGVLDDSANKMIDKKKKSLSTSFLVFALANKYSPYCSSKEANKFKSVEQIVKYNSEEVYSKHKVMGNRIYEQYDLDKNKGISPKVEAAYERAISLNRIQSIELCDTYMKENLEKIFEVISSIKTSKEGRIKIFLRSSSLKIDDSIDNYKEEEVIYLVNYMFNKDKNKGSMTIVDGVFKGLIPFGYNNNASKAGIKPTLMNIRGVKMHSFEEAQDVMLVFQLLKTINDNTGSSSFGFNNWCSDNLFSLDINELVSLNSGNKSAFYKLNFQKKYIENYDLRAEYDNYDDILANKTIECYDYLDGSNKKLYVLKDRRSRYTVQELLAILIGTRPKDINKYSEYNFSTSFYKENGANSYEKLAGVLFERYKYNIHSFLNEKQASSSIKSKILNGFIDECIKLYCETMYVSKYFFSNLKDFLNIKMNLLNDFEEANTTLALIDKMTSSLMEVKKKNNALVINNDEEFFFLLGQLSYYIESRSKGTIDFGIFKFYTDKKNISSLKKYLRARFENYSYNININDKYFRETFSKVLEYEPTKGIGVYTSEYYVGLCAENIFYKKIETKND